MVNQEKIGDFLRGVEEKYPQLTRSRLTKGTLVPKSDGVSYEIDDPEIDRQLGAFQEGVVPYNQIHQRLKGSDEELLRAINGDSKVPFSRVFNQGLGQCVEKAILVQLAAQRGRKSFLVNGSLSVDGGYMFTPHGFNIVFKEGNPYLVDAENPSRIKPYIVPVLGLDEETAEFSLPKELSEGRIYSIT